MRPVKLDPSQIDQILANLCVNSRDAIAGVGEVSVETGSIYVTSAPGKGMTFKICLPEIVEESVATSVSNKAEAPGIPVTSIYC